MATEEKKVVTGEKKEGKSGRWASFWWTLSVVVHVGAVLAATMFTPLRQWIFTKAERDYLGGVTEARVGKMVSEVLNSQVRQLSQKIEQQKKILEDLTRLRDNRYSKYAAERKYLLDRGRKDITPIEPMDVMGSPGPDPKGSLQKKGVAELYDIAIRIEQTTFGTYRQMRAAELARLQYLSLKAAYDVSTIQLPAHPPINAEALSRSITNVKDGSLDEMKAELARVYAEVASMVAAAQRMLDLAIELVGEDIGSIVGYGTGGSGVTAGGGGANDDPDPGRNRQPVFTGYSPPAADAFSHRWGAGVGPVVHKNELYPAEAGADLGKTPPVPGRMLMKEGAKADWMYIDTWYIIGPFPNPDRVNIDKKFPPEAGIDLDATYIGAQGRLLKWMFRQSYTVCVIPHAPDNYCIWYAYTDIYSDRDQDRWCIFGSDDFGKAWLVDPNPEKYELIYASGKTPHPWIPDRAYKKVHFKKGYNPVLFKLENAWGQTGFSMCVYLGEM